MTCQGKPGVTGSGRTPRLHTMLCQQMPTPWARGIPPGVSSTFHVLAWCREHGTPEFSPHLAPDTNTRCLAAGQGLHRF